MSKVVWSPEKGWHDDGQEVSVVANDGKIVIVDQEGNVVAGKVVVG